MKTTLGAAALLLAFAAPALAGDPLLEAMPLDPKAPITLGIGRPNGDALARKAKADLEPYLSRVLSRPVKVEILRDYDALAAALADGKVDIAWTTPLAFVIAAERRREVTAIAKAMRGNELFYRAALIVRADSPLQKLEQLQGRRVAWVSRSSSSGYLFPRALLAAQGHDPDRWFASEIFAGDHPGVCQAVREQRVDVGATFADEPPRGRPLQADGCAESPPMNDFRVVAAGGPIPNDVIAARPGFDDRLVEPVLAAFARMSRDEDGKRILEEDFHADGWGVAVEGDFKAVQDLRRAQPRKKDEVRKDARKGKARR